MNCKYTNCNKKANKTWALVPLCSNHHELIKDETLKYYKKYPRCYVQDRPHYINIALEIPWRRDA